MNKIEKITSDQIKSIHFQSSEHSCFSWKAYLFEFFLVNGKCIVHIDQEPVIANQIPLNLEFSIKPYVFDFIVNKAIRLVNKDDVNPSAGGSSTTTKEFLIEVKKNNGECITIKGETRSPFIDLSEMEKEFKRSNINIKKRINKLRGIGGFYISDAATKSFIEQTYRDLRKIYFSNQLPA